MNVVRAAAAADLDDVVAVFRACWTVSYRDVLPEEVIATIDPPAAQALWQRAFATAGADELLVAERGGHVLGVARWAVTAPGVGWLHSLYVDPHAQGGGVGGALLAAVEARLRAAGVATAHLWAFGANARGRRFYAAQGWRLDGETRVEEQFGEPEVRFTKQLGGCRPADAGEGAA